MLSPVCDETAAKLRLISDMAKLTAESLPTEQKSLRSSVKSFFKGSGGEKACLHLSIIEIDKPKLGCIRFT